MNIGIFCSANDNIDRNYFEMTAELGRWCARNGHSIVFGGCNMGLMGCIAEAFKGASRAEKDKVEGDKVEGGQVIGIVPRIIERGGRTSEHLTVHIPCDNLSDRKDLLLAHSDFVVALPGGIGSTSSSPWPQRTPSATTTNLLCCITCAVSGTASSLCSTTCSNAA